MAPREISRYRFLLRAVCSTALLCAFFLLPQRASADHQNKTRVLILHSYNKGYVWTDEIGEGIEAVLKSALPDLEINTEYMDTKNISDRRHLNNLYTTYKNKFSRKRFDIVITSDDHAFQFMLRHGNEIFPGTPVVFNGVNNFNNVMFDRSLLAGRDLFTGVVEDVDIKNTLETALAFHPDTRQVVVINDTSAVGKALHRQTVTAVSSLSRPVDLVFYEDMGIQEIMERVRRLPQDSIVLFLIFFRDKSGTVFTHDESFRMIQRNISVPVYTCWDIYNGLGVAGGMLANGYSQGEISAQLALRILHGEKPSSIPIMKSPNKYMFDYQQLKRFGVDPSRAPAGSIIFNRPFPYYEGNKKSIWGVSAFIALQTAVIILLLVNIKRRKFAEKALNESERRFQHLIERSPVAMAVADKSNKFLHINEKFIQTFGYTLQDMPTVGDWWPRAYPDEAYRQKVFDRWHAAAIKAVKERRETENQEWRVTCKDGRVRDIEFRMASVHDMNIVIFHDITERKRTAEALRESERRFRDLLETVHLVAVMLDREGNITFCNEYLLNLTGWSRDEALNKNWFELFVPIDMRSSVESIFTKSIADASITFYHENPIITREGVRRLIVWDSSLLRDHEGAIIGTASLGRDVTEHRKLEEQLRQAQKMEAIGQLAGGIAHDFNNILAAITGYASLLKIKFAGDETLSGFVDRILTSSDRAASLTRSLLAFSRKQAVDLRPVNINDIIRGIQDMLSRLIGEDIECKLDLSTDDMITKADRGQIEQVLMNLATNARDAMPRGGTILIRTSSVFIDGNAVKIHNIGEPGAYAVITVADTGIGMDKSTQERIFEPFFTTKEIGKGTGLGLSMVYGIIKKHEGYINVYGEPGRGTTFKIYLPLIESETKGEVKAEKDPPCFGNETILLIEDDRTVRQITRAILEEFGYKIIEAINGEDALAIYREKSGSIQIIISDVIMPGKTGKEVAEEIKEKINPDVKIIFVSGYASDFINQRGIMDGDEHFISKPVHPDELLRKVREVLDN